MVTRDVVLVIGPPGGGKTTLAARISADGGHVHLEREMCSSDAQFRAVVEATCASHARVVVVRCCVRPAELDRWLALTGADRLVVADPGADVTMDRIRDRGRMRADAEMRACEQWYAAQMHNYAGWVCSRMHKHAE